MTMTHKYLILILFCTWGPPLRFIGCSRMDAKAIVNAICHENSAACLPWFIFCKHIIKDHPAVIGASSSFFPRQCLLWVPAIGWKEGAHIDVYTPPPHFFHALVTCKTEFYFACLIFYSSMEGILSKIWTSDYHQKKVASKNSNSNQSYTLKKQSGQRKSKVRFILGLT